MECEMNEKGSFPLDAFNISLISAFRVFLSFALHFSFRIFSAGVFSYFPVLEQRNSPDTAEKHIEHKIKSREHNI